MTRIRIAVVAVAATLLVGILGGAAGTALVAGGSGSSTASGCDAQMSRAAEMAAMHAAMVDGSAGHPMGGMMGGGAAGMAPHHAGMGLPQPTGGPDR